MQDINYGAFESLIGLKFATTDKVLFVIEGDTVDVVYKDGADTLTASGRVSNIDYDEVEVSRMCELMSSFSGRHHIKSITLDMSTKYNSEYVTIPLMNIVDIISNRSGYNHMEIENVNLEVVDGKYQLRFTSTTDPIKVLDSNDNVVEFVDNGDSTYCIPVTNMTEYLYYTVIGKLNIGTIRVKGLQPITLPATVVNNKIKEASIVLDDLMNDTGVYDVDTLYVDILKGITTPDKINIKTLDGAVKYTTDQKVAITNKHDEIIEVPPFKVNNGTLSLLVSLILDNTKETNILPIIVNEWNVNIYV